MRRNDNLHRNLNISDVDNVNYWRMLPDNWVMTINTCPYTKSNLYYQLDD